jgi:hypothetical protein
MAQPSERSRIEKLIAHHEQQLAALRTVHALLAGDEQASSARRSKSTVTQALRLEAGRRSNGDGPAEHGPYYVPEERGRRSEGKGHHKAAVLARREQAAAFLAEFDRTIPRPRTYGGKRLGAFISNGYLRQTDEGILRTDKVYEVDPRAPRTAPAPKVKKPNYWNKAATTARREKTAAYLDTFSPTKPQPLTDGAKHGATALVKNGYLKKRGDGYVRTAKAFTP